MKRSSPPGLAALFLFLGVGCGMSGADAASRDPAGDLTTVAVPAKPDDSKGRWDVQRASATYTVTVYGDIQGGPVTGEDDVDGQIVLDQPGIVLDLTFFQTALDGGGDCFAAGFYTGSLDIQDDRRGPFRAETMFFFRRTGTGNDAGTEITGQLTLDGSIHGAWPPAVGNTTVISGDTWSMQTRGCDKPRLACVGSGSMTYTIEITRNN